MNCRPISKTQKIAAQDEAVEIRDISSFVIAKVSIRNFILTAKRLMPIINWKLQLT